MSKKTNVYILLLALLIVPSIGISQDNLTGADTEKFRRNRISAGIGHAHIPSATQIESTRFTSIIPSWGFSYSFNFTKRFSLGLKSDFEIAEYVIKDGEGNELERENPISLALSFEYKVYKELAVFVAPGIEFEDSDNLVIGLVGVSYEVEIRNGWDFTPELVFEQKGGHTGAITFALAVGYSF